METTGLRRKLEFTDPQSTTFGLSELATNVAMPYDITPRICDETREPRAAKDPSEQTNVQFNQFLSDAKSVSAFNTTFCSQKKPNNYQTPPRMDAVVKRLKIDDQSN